MATRSRIGIELRDGSILSAYAHWDGYPEWMGRILRTHYNTKEKVAELIDGGDMSSPWTNATWHDSDATNVYGPQYYSQRGENCPPRLDADLCEYLLPNNSEEYGPEYYSQRGEDSPPRYDSDLNEYLSNSEEYSYVFTKDGEWVCYTNDYRFPDVVKQVEIPSAALHV